MALPKPKLRTAPAAAAAEATAAKAAPAVAVADAEELHDSSTPYGGDEEAAAPPAKAVTAPPKPAPTPAKSTALAVAHEPEENDGFDGLDQEIGFGSFEILKLDKSEFICKEESFKSFEAVLHQGRKKFIFKANKSEDCSLLVYSYDEETGTDGRSLEDHFNEWRMAGELEADASPVKARYFELAAQITKIDDKDEHELVGDMVLLSIPPASVTRLAGYKAKLKLKKRKLNKVVTLIQPGKKITLPNKKTFHPWDFKFVEDVIEVAEDDAE